MRGVAMLLAGAALTSLLAAAPSAHAQESTWMVTPPDTPAGAAKTGPVAVLRHDAETGTVTLALTRGGRDVLAPSPVGIVTEQSDLSTGLRFLWRTDRVVEERYTTTVGKRVERVAVMTEARLTFAGS
ncbi:hypothetical protein ABN034_12800 [Actinopolymorpha sp. B11F2]|uniref:hypothetical protein n=1 Tax=Actinopolymorpha sp. B11F2 TaxID=3160862 RepID=UPI0032E3F77F